MMKARLAALAGAAFLAYAGAAHAAVVPLKLSLGHPAAEAATARAEGGATGLGSHQPLVLDPAWAEDDGLTTFFSEPAGGAPPYGLHAGAREAAGKAAALARARPGPVGGDIGADHQAPFYNYLLSAGQYVLEVGTLSDKYSAPTEVSAVPLPGAMWLFGSALVAFLWISSRRKL